MSNRWSESEEEILKEHYSTHTSKQISSKLLEDRTPKAIRRKAERLNLESSSMQDNGSTKITCQLCDKEYAYRTGNGQSKKYCSYCMSRRKSIAYKKAIVSLFGGSCSKCNYCRCYSALTFHHTGEKNFQLSRLADYSYQMIANELENVQLVCENCHNIEHCEGSRGLCPEHTWESRCCTEDDPCNRSCHTMHLRHERRLQFIEKRGSECENCGYSGCTGVLSFHHRDPEEKSFSLDVTAFSRSMDSLEKEVAKCDLLCHNCHQKHHCECEVKCGDMFEEYAERAEEQIRSYL